MDDSKNDNSIIDDLHDADVDLALNAGQLRHTTFMSVAGTVSEIADQPPAFTLATAAMIGGLVTGRPRLARTGARVLASLAVATWIKATIKSKVVRTRPHKLLDEGHYETGLDGPDEGPYNSFPSGHTANAVAAARAIDEPVLPKGDSARQRPGPADLRAGRESPLLAAPADARCDRQRSHSVPTVTRERQPILKASARQADVSGCRLCPIDRFFVVPSWFWG